MMEDKKAAAKLAGYSTNDRLVAVLIKGVLVLLIIVASKAGASDAQGTRVGFYNSTCPGVETIVRDNVKAKFAQDSTIVAALLRMLFHDCFVNGCDASILLDSNVDPQQPTEKEADPNQTVRGYEIIDEIKAKVEEACPGIVSCADIIVLAVRDAIVEAGGPNFEIPCGRLDGLVSSADEANIEIVGPRVSVNVAKAAFAGKGLTLTDLVVLLGAHTVGVAHCSFFSDRVYNFQGSGTADPSMNTTLVRKLKGVCPDPATGGADPTVALDQTPSTGADVFDNGFYSQLQQRNGLLQIDQELTGDARTAPLALQLSADRARFFETFAQSLVNLGNVQVKTSPLQGGQVRLNCRSVNPLSPPPAPASPPPATSSPPPPAPASPPPSTSPPPTPSPPSTSPPPPPPPPPHHHHHHHRHLRRRSH